MLKVNEKIEKIKNVIEILENKENLELKEKLILEKLYEQKNNLEQIILEKEKNEEKGNITNNVGDGILEDSLEPAIDITLEGFKQGGEIIIKLSEGLYDAGSTILESVLDIFDI